MSATPESTGTDIVFDATVLSNFARIGQFPRLERIYAGLYLHLLAPLGSGQASCLAAARMRNMILATDDRAARRKVVEQGVRLTGTLGILIRLVRDAHLPLAQANKLLEEMVQQGYRSPVQELDSLV